VDENCPFCAIASGTGPASVVYEDAIVIVIVDRNPVTTGHLLVIPKQHMPYMADMDEETGSHLFRITMRMAQALRRSGLKCEGINLFLADGKTAFQEVFHLHMHVFPRFVGDTFRIAADWSVHPSREEMDAVAATIRQADAVYSQSRQLGEHQGLSLT